MSRSPRKTSGVEAGEMGAGGTELLVRAVPRSSHDRVAGIVGGRLKVCVTPPAEKGRANDRVLEVVARFFGLSPSKVVLLSGASGREKRLWLEGMSPGRLKEKIDGIA